MTTWQYVSRCAKSHTSDSFSTLIFSTQYHWCHICWWVIDLRVNSLCLPRIYSLSFSHTSLFSDTANCTLTSASCPLSTLSITFYHFSLTPSSLWLSASSTERYWHGYRWHWCMDMQFTNWWYHARCLTEGEYQNSHEDECQIINWCSNISILSFFASISDIWNFQK